MYRFKGIPSTRLQILTASTGIGMVHLGPPDIPLRIPDSYHAKVAKIYNLWTLWPVIQLIIVEFLNSSSCSQHILWWSLWTTLDCPRGASLNLAILIINHFLNSKFKNLEALGK